MKRLILLAVAASLAGCHSRNTDQAGAAPDRGDTIAVTHQIDPERTGPPGTAGRPSGHEVTPDSLGIDSAAVRSDTNRTSAIPTSVPQDTLGPRAVDSSAAGAGWSDSAARDTSGMR